MPRKKFDHPIWAELYDVIVSRESIDRSTILYLVRLREQFQKMRKSGDNICRAAAAASGEAGTRRKRVVELVSTWSETSEAELEYLFKQIVKQDPVSTWAASIIGISHVFATILRAYIAMDWRENVGTLWRFAGLDPTCPRPKKGEKLHHCKYLKTTCFLIGESFKKVSGNPRSFYGAQYKARKLQEVAKNKAGDFAEQAAQKLRDFKIGRTTEAYKWYSQDMLPPAHLDMRAMRWTTKLFLAHWFQVAYRHEKGKEPPAPYVIAALNHSDVITVDDVMAYESKEIEGVA